MLSGVNPYTGDTNINGGTLSITNAANTTTGHAIIGAGATLNLASFSNYGVASAMGSRLLSADAGGDIGLFFQGGTLQYTGATAQSTNRSIRLSTTGGGGTIDASGSVPSATLSFTATSSVNFFENNGLRTLTLTGSNTGANSFGIGFGDTAQATSLTKSGVGTWNLSGASTYTGNTTISGGTLNITATNTTTGVVTIGAGATLNLASFSNYGVASAMGSRLLSSDAGGTIGLFFQGGTLQYTGATAQSTNRAIRLSTTGGGGTIDASGSDPSATLSFTATSSPNFFENNGLRTLTLTGSNTGANSFGIGFGDTAQATSLTKSGAGTWILTGTNTYSGQTAINGGILQISASNNLGNASATNTIAFNAGTLQSTANSYDLGVNRAITLNGAGTIQSDASTLTVSGSVTNGANLLTVTGAGNTTISGVIGSGAGGLTKSGAGTLVLSNLTGNSYTGGTTVNAGILLAGNTTGSATGSGAVVISQGATHGTLGGTGIISASSVTLNGDGTVPNNAVLMIGNTNNLAGTAGNLTLGASGPVNLGGMIQFDIFDRTSATNTFGAGNNDLLTLLDNGVVNFGSTAIVKVNDVFAGGLSSGTGANLLAAGDSWRLIDWTAYAGGTGTQFATFNLPTLSGFGWDTSSFYTAGTISLTAIPEPSRAVLMLLGAAGLLMRRRRAA